MIRRLFTSFRQSLDNTIEPDVAALYQQISQLGATADSARAESADEVVQCIAQGVCYGALQSHLLKSGQNVANADLAKAIDLVVTSLIKIGCSLIGSPGQSVQFEPSLHSNLQPSLISGEDIRISVPGLTSPSGTVIRKAVVSRLS